MVRSKVAPGLDMYCTDSDHFPLVTHAEVDVKRSFEADVSRRQPMCSKSATCDRGKVRCFIELMACLLLGCVDQPDPRNGPDKLVQGSLLILSVLILLTDEVSYSQCLSCGRQITGSLFWFLYLYGTYDCQHILAQYCRYDHVPVRMKLVTRKA